MAEIKEVLKYGTSEEQLRQGADIIDTRKDKVDIPPGVETWLREVEKVSQGNTNVVKDDRTGQPVMTTAAPTNPVVQLPVTKTVFRKGFKKKIDEAGRWLSEFILRVIKIKVKTKKNIIHFKDDA
jgi:hypothetical protein